MKLYLSVLLSIFLILIVIIAVNKFIYTEPDTYEDLWVVDVWLFGGSNWTFYLKVDLSDEGHIETYKNEFNLRQEPSIDDHLPQPMHADKIIQEFIDSNLESGSIKLNEEQVKQLRKHSFRLVADFNNREPKDMSDGFGECKVRYKGEWYSFYYSEKDEFITKLIQLSPVPIISRLGTPMVPYEITNNDDYLKWVKEKDLLVNK